MLVNVERRTVRIAWRVVVDCTEYYYIPECAWNCPVSGDNKIDRLDRLQLRICSILPVTGTQMLNAVRWSTSSASFTFSLDLKTTNFGRIKRRRFIWEAGNFAEFFARFRVVMVITSVVALNIITVTLTRSILIGIMRWHTCHWLQVVNKMKGKAKAKFLGE